MSTEMISAVFTGVSGLLGALTVLFAGLSRRRSEDSRALRKAYRLLQKRFTAALDLIWEYEQITPRNKRLPRPEILEQDDDDDGPAPTPAQANAPA